MCQCHQIPATGITARRVESEAGILSLSLGIEASEKGGFCQVRADGRSAVGVTHPV